MRILLVGFLLAFGFGCEAPVRIAQQNGDLAKVAERVTISGFSCENGYGEDINQTYFYQGRTKDGRPYYRGSSRTDRYIYHDARCSDDSPQPRWILGGKPDVTRTSDLNLRDNPGCENDLGVVSDAREVASGSFQAHWQWCGDRGYRGRTIAVVAE